MNKDVILFCNDYQNIENYDKMIKSNERWCCHHRLETHFSDGTPRPKNAQLSREELKSLDMYYNRPAEELIFLTNAEHTSLHFKGRPSPKSEVAKKHMSESAKKRCTPEWKKEHSERLKGKSFPHPTLKGREPWNKGKTGLYHFSDETKEKLSKNIKGRKWYNNGQVEIRDFTCPNGFIPGRLVR